MQNTPHNAPVGFDWVTHLKDWKQTGDVVQITAGTAHGQNARMSFQALTPEIWHITFRPLDAQLIPTPIVVGISENPVEIQVNESEGEFTVTGPCLALQIDRDPWQLHFRDSNGIDVLRENPSDIDGLGRPFVLPLGFASDAAGLNLVTASFHLRPDEHFFGLGEKFTPLDKVGQRIVSWTQDAFGSTSERSHKNIPFLMSTRGYGLLLNSGARITWDMGVTSCQSYTVAVEAESFDAYVIYGSSMEAILERYTLLTGRSPVPPKWTFGLWLSSTGAYRDQATIERLVDGLETHNIAADVIHVDTWWMKWRTYCDFRWDRIAFPDVEGFIAGLKQKGLKISLWEHPYISVESDLFEVGKENGYFLKRPNGEVYVIDYGLSLAPRPDGVIRIATADTSWNAQVAIIDLTNPRAYAWFQDLHRPVLRMGVDAFKTDFGEDVPPDAVFSSGQTGETMHNLYPLLYNQCVYEVTQQELGYGMVWSRSGTAGNQRYPVCWSGDPAADFDSLACTIRGGLSIGLSGVPFWSHDIGAYRGMPSSRLYVRWAQFGLFCSHSRMHGDSAREPWFFDQKIVDIVRDYVNLRYSLFPYLYSSSHEASRTGMPVIRAMPLMFPQDSNTYGQDLQYMFGPWLLVAPIYDEGDSRRVYLPEGEWVDYWTRQIHRGPISITVNAPLNILPLFVRRGAIIPKMQAARRIPQGTIDPLVVEVYVDSQMAYRFYEDESVTEFRGQLSDERFSLRWTGGSVRAYKLHLIGLNNVKNVQVVNSDNSQSVSSNWHVSSNGTLEIEIPSMRDGHLELSLS